MESFEEVEPITVTSKELYTEIVKLYSESIYIKKDGRKYLIFPLYRVRQDLEDFVKFNTTT